MLDQICSSLILDASIFYHNLVFLPNFLFSFVFFFFFQAEDGIRDGHVTGVQTCALPISVLGNFMYSSFIHRTRQKVQQARSLHPPQTAHPHGSFGQEGFADDGVGPVGPTTDTWERPNATGAQVPGAAEAAGEEGSTSRWHAIWRSMVERYGRRRIVVSIVTVFVLLAGTVTVIELAAGRPMADIVRNENGGGTSLFGGSASADSETGDSGEPDDSGGPGQREQNPGEQNQDEQQNQQDQSNQDQRNEQPPAEGPAEEQLPDEGPEDTDQQDEQPPAEESNPGAGPDAQPPAEEPADDAGQQEPPPAEGTQ